MTCATDLCCMEEQYVRRGQSLPAANVFCMKYAGVPEPFRRKGTGCRNTAVLQTEDLGVSGSLAEAGENGGCLKYKN